MDKRVKNLSLQLLLPLLGGAAAGSFLLSGAEAGLQKRLLHAVGTGGGASGASALVLYARNRRRKCKRQPAAKNVKAVSAVTPLPRPPSPPVKLPVVVPFERQVAPSRLEISVRRSEGIVVVIATNFVSKNSRKVLRKKLKEIQPVTWEEHAVQEEPPAKLLQRAGTFPVSLSEQAIENEVALKLLALGAHFNGKESTDWFKLAL